MKRILTIILSLWTTISLAQTEERDTTSITVGGYVDAYYAWYDNAYNVALQQHNCIGAYHNSLGLNTAQFTTAFSSDRVRGVATFHYGDIAAIAWADQYRPIQEANAGIRLAKNLWLDAGYFKTHVGTESFLPKDNLLSIITLGTYYGPFYQGGARLGYDVNNTHLELHLTNGYNLHIDNNRAKTVGLLASQSFGESSVLTYSAAYGSEQVGALSNDDLFYQNVNFNYARERLTIQVGLDIAMVTRGSSSFNEPLITALLTAKYALTDDFSIAGRVEYFSDEDNLNSFALLPYYDIRSDSSSVFVKNGATGGTGLNIVGLTAGLEYSPSDFGFLRLETRYLNDLNGIEGIGVIDEPGNYNAIDAGVNPHVTTRLGVILTAGIYFDKTFTFAR